MMPIPAASVAENVPSTIVPAAEAEQERHPGAERREVRVKARLGQRRVHAIGQQLEIHERYRGVDTMDTAANLRDQRKRIDRRPHDHASVRQGELPERDVDRGGGVRSTPRS